MKNCCGMILSLLMPLACPAAEIVAWKVPLSRFVDRGLEAEGIVRCKSAPEASPFFKEWDELWDLKDAMLHMPGNQEMLLDWLVWDATSEQLVAKGSWSDICTIHEILRPGDMPVSLHLKLEIHQVAANGAALGGNSKAISEMSIRVRSGQNYTASWSGSGSSITADIAATLDESDHVADIQLSLSAEVPEQPRLKVDTAFTLKTDNSLWLARDFDGKAGLDLKATCQMESINGIPILERVMIQTAKGTRSLISRWERQNAYPTLVERGGWKVRCKLSPASLTEFLSQEPEDEIVDPFAESVFPKAHVALPRVASVKPPSHLWLELDHELLDASEWLRKILPNTDFVGSFAGYDPIEEALHFYSPKQEPADAVAAMFAILYCGGRPGGVVATLDGIGQTRLVSKSGQKSSLSRIAGEKSVQRLLEIEPTIGETGDMIDMGLFYEDLTDVKSKIRLISFNTLVQGKQLELLSGKASGGAERSLRIRGDILLLSPENQE